MENLLIFAVVTCAVIYVARRLLFRAACGCGCGSGAGGKKGTAGKGGAQDSCPGIDACAACRPDIYGIGHSAGNVAGDATETGAGTENPRASCCSCGK